MSEDSNEINEVRKQQSLSSHLDKLAMQLNPEFFREEEPVEVEKYTVEEILETPEHIVNELEADDIDLDELQTEDDLKFFKEKAEDSEEVKAIKLDLGDQKIIWRGPFHLGSDAALLEVNISDTLDFTPLGVEATKIFLAVLNKAVTRAILLGNRHVALEDLNNPKPKNDRK